MRNPLKESTYQRISRNVRDGLVNSWKLIVISAFIAFVPYFPLPAQFEILTFVPLIIVLWIIVRSASMAPFQQRNEAREIANDWTKSAYYQMLEVIREHGPIDIPKIIEAVGLMPGEKSHIRIANQLIEDRLIEKAWNDKKFIGFRVRAQKSRS